MLVTSTASAWHVRRTLEDLRRALPEAEAALLAGCDTLARISPQFPEVSCIEQSSPKQHPDVLEEGFDLVIVVGQMDRATVSLARRLGARLLVQYNAQGYFAGGAAFGSPAEWHRRLLTSALRRAIVVPLVWLLARTYRASFALRRAIPGRHPVEITCLSCQQRSDAPLHWAGPGKVPYVRCSDCGLVQLSERPSDAQLANAYEDEKAQRDYIETRTDAVTRCRQERVLAAMERLSRRGRMLDIGCADGRFLEVAADAGWQVEGVETSSVFARHAETLLGPVVHVGTLEDVALGDDRFDAANLSHVIEHLSDPRGHLAEIRRVLKSGGIVAISTPDADGLSALVQKERWPPSAYEPHVSLFGLRQLVRLLRETGFEILEVHTQALGRILYPLWTSTLFRWIPAFLRRRIETHEPQLNEYLGMVGMGEELLILARKE